MLKLRVQKVNVVTDCYLSALIVLRVYFKHGCQGEADGMVVKYSKECDVEMCVYAAGFNAKKISSVISDYVPNHSLLSLCELSCDRCEYFIKHIFADADGDYQYILCGSDGDSPPDPTYSYRVLTLPTLFPLDAIHIGLKISARRVKGVNYEFGDSCYIVCLNKQTEVYIFNWREKNCSCIIDHNVDIVGYNFVHDYHSDRSGEVLAYI